MMSLVYTYAENKSYTINDMFTISIDSKLELRDKDGLYVQKMKNNNLPVTSEDVIVFQQAGLNNDKKAAYKKYARIMIRTKNGKEGDFAYYDGTHELSDSDTVYLNRLAYQELSPNMHMTINPNTKGRFLDNGYYCIMTSYQRSGVYGNVDVRIYYFFNDSQSAKVLYSYKNSEKQYWQTIMEDAIKSFRWTNTNGKSFDGNDEVLDTARDVSVHTGAQNKGEGPINGGLVIAVLTIIAVFVCVWLLNTNKIARKEKWIFVGLMAGVFGFIILYVPIINAAYESNSYPNDPKLELAVEKERKRLPIQIAKGMVLKDMELKDSAVVSTIEIDETKYSFDVFLVNKDLNKRILAANMAKSIPFESCSSFVDFANCGYSAKLIIRGVQSHREIVLVATAEEIKNAPDEALSPREKLDLYLNATKHMHPNENGVTQSDAEIKGKQFIIIYTIDENVYDMNELKKYKNDLRYGTEEELKKARKDLVLLLAPLDMSLKVSYVGSISKKQVNIEIPAAFLKKIVSDNQHYNEFEEY
jgi:hypothetical protein